MNNLTNSHYRKGAWQRSASKPEQRLRDLVRCLVYALLLGVIAPAVWAEAMPEGGFSPTTKAQKRVLVLFGLGLNSPALHQVTSGFNAAVNEGNLFTGNVDREMLDLTPQKHPEQIRVLRERLLSKYSGQHFDLIITVFNPALDLLQNEGVDLFPDTPVIAILANKRPSLQRAGQVVVQHPENSDMQGTLKLALDLFPDTARVIFVSGSTPDSQERERRARAEFRTWETKLSFEYTSNLPLSAMLEHVAKVPGHTIILYSLITTDDEGKPVIPEVAALMLGRTANAPIFSHVSTMLDTGVVGGMMLDLQAYGDMLGHAVARFVRGQPIALEPTSAYMEPRFDWNQIQRWNADYHRLPDNSVFINRPLTLWTQYKREVTAALGVMVFLVLALVLLLAEVQRRRKAELAALDSATSLRVLKETNEHHLREEVQQRTSELQNEILLRTQAERRAQEEQRQFIAMVSHEFRTPLAIISATTERLAGKAETLNAVSRAGYLKIQNSVDWLTTLLDEYLTEERLTALGQGLNTAPTSPGDLVREAAKKAGEISARHTFQVDVSALPQSFALDAGLMRLAFLILAENAVKHTPPGTTITLTGAVPSHGGMTITVADNGPGIPEDELALVLHKFFRGRRSAATYGSGLGLYLAQRVIGLHGGMIVASNRQGGGAQFQMSLPAAPS